MKLPREIVGRLATASLWSLLGAVVNRLSAFAVLLLAARIVGRQDFGAVGLIISTAGTISLLSGLALGVASTRYIAAARVADGQTASDYVKIILLSGLLVSSIVLASLLAFSDRVTTFLLGGTEHRAAVCAGLWLAASIGLFDLLRGILAGFERFGCIATMSILSGTLSLIVIGPFGQLYGVTGVIWSLLIGNLMALVWGLIRLCTMMASIDGFWTRMPDWRLSIGLAKFAAPMYLAGLIATPAIWWVSWFLVQQHNGMAELGGYNAAYQFHGPLVFLPIILMSSSVPVLVQLWEESKISQFLKVTAYISSGVFVFSIIPAAIMILYSGELISLFGSDFKDVSLVLKILVLAAPFHGISKILTSSIMATNKPSAEMFSNVVFSATLLSAAILLIPGYGALGFAWSFLMAHAFSMVVKCVIVLLTVSAKYRSALAL